MKKKSVRDLELKGKRVFLRVDLNVTLDPEGKIIEENKLNSALPTLRYLQENGARTVIGTHLGRPGGEVVDGLRLDVVAQKLADLLDTPVFKVDQVVGEEARAAAERLQEGEILMLENLRFHRGETENDGDLARQLAGLADYYVNDAFGSAHRAHASTEGIARLLPAVAGLTMEREIEVLGRIMEKPDKPMVVILGGTKVADKIDVIYHFMEVSRALLIGGGMANTFLKARGIFLGDSFVEEDKVGVAEKILEKAAEEQVKMFLPVDFIVARDISAGADQRVVSVDSIPEGWKALDIGPETREIFRRELEEARAIVWNGPLGYIELEAFAQGTMELAHFIAGLSATKVIGGGDIVAAVERAGVAHQMTHISTGGGSTLEFWSGKKLPALEVLLDK